MIDNSFAYNSIGLIINHSEYGFYLMIASEKAQQEVVDHYNAPNIAIHDFRKSGGEYSFSIVHDLIETVPNAKVYFLLNFHLTMNDDSDIQRLNFNRDSLIRLKKNIVFCVTPRCDELLSLKAPDLYSYVKFSFTFIEENPEPIDKLDNISDKFDLSKGIDEPVIDFTMPPMSLLSQAISLTNHADQLIEKFRFADALILLDKVLEIRLTILGENNPDTASTYSLIANVCYNMGRYIKAMEWNMKALKIRERMLGMESPFTADTYIDLGDNYFANENYAEAYEWYEKALHLYENIFGIEHIKTAEAYRCIGSVCREQVNYEKALEWFYKSLVIIQKVLGEVNNDTADIYNDIASVYYDLKDYASAMNWYIKSKDISENVLGKEHPETGAIYNNIANLLHKQGKFNLAMEWFSKSLEICEKNLGNEHPTTAIIYSNIAQAYYEQDEYVKALKLKKKAYETFLRVYGVDHKITIGTGKSIENIQEIVLSKSK